MSLRDILIAIAGGVGKGSFSKYSLYLALLITFCVGILCILYQKNRDVEY